MATAPVAFPQEQNSPAEWSNAASRAGITLADLVVYINALRRRETELHHRHAKMNLAISVLRMYESGTPDEALRKFCSCVGDSCGLTVVVDDADYGRMLPCGCKMHTACMREHEACPLCNVPYSNDITMMPTVLMAMSEVLLAANILRAGEHIDGTLAQYRERFTDVAPNAQQPLRALVVGQKSKEEIVAMARTLALAERARLQASAADIVRRLAVELVKPKPFPTPNRTASAPARAASVASPAVRSPVKRPAAAKSVSHAPPDLRADKAMPEGAVLPPPPDGKHHRYNGIVVIPSKFPGKCTGCGQMKVKDLTLVSPQDAPGGGGVKWLCAMCVHGVTSADIYNSLVGDNDVTTAAATEFDDLVDVDDMF